MPSDYELAISRFQTFLRDVIEPAVYPVAFPLDASVCQFTDPRGPLPTAAVASAGTFIPIDVGFNWGPQWSTAWFTVKGSIPAQCAGRTTVLRFSSGTEAQVWVPSQGGWEPAQGLDVHRDAWPLFEQTPPDSSVHVLIEAACNHPFGVLGFEWDPPEVHARWQSATPGRLERCEVAVRDNTAAELRHLYAFALGLLKELAPASNRAGQLFQSLREATAAVEALPAKTPAPPARSPMLTLTPASVHNATAVLQGVLAQAPAASATLCFAVGHAHIDTAWLWPIRETRRKCLRSFSNQLRLMEQFDQYIFLCSQAQQYAWVKEDSPELFEQIQERVKQGRWEPSGGMWVEPDCNCPSGESLVRQILHGTLFWRQHFGDAAPQRMLYLPDTFGFPATLPQIMKLGGLDTFVTNKMIWNRSNVFPHTSFVWRGLDGSSVLAHNTPGHDYNAVNTPKELARGEANHRTKGIAPALWLQPFGYGDGGGGATETSIRFAQLAAECDGLARTQLARADSFCAALHAQYAEHNSSTTPPFPLWSGELYLEIHRGTLTTQAWIKEANRRAEEELRFCELLIAAAPRAGAEHAAPSAKLDKAWKSLLLNQFHDILPGTSIGWVYEDARRDFARISKVTSTFIEHGTTAWLAGLSTLGIKQPVGVFNQCSVVRSGVVELADGRTIFARAVPAMGVAVVDAAAPHGCVPVSLTQDHATGAFTLSNGLITVIIDQKGEITSLARDGAEVAQEPAVRTTELNTLELYEDVPHMWDAWDIDPQYEEKPRDAQYEISAVEVVCEEPLRCALRFSRSLGTASTIEQTYILDAASPRIDVHNKVDWHEHRTLLRARFPTSILAQQASYEVQFGVVERPTHRNTTWDAARFEVCAHRWMDLSQPGLGLALLNDGKYGHSCHQGELGLSLLRAPKHPDPTADIGLHEFTYSLMPHTGDWRSAGVDREAEALNLPLMGYLLNPGEAGDHGTAYVPFTITTLGAARVAISAVKPSEDGRGVVLRLWECHGGRGTCTLRWNAPRPGGNPQMRVEAVNLLEERLELDVVPAQQGASFAINPWQIVSLMIT